jgi:hypothetical protein
MDDPTRRCENDTGNGFAPYGALVPKQEPHFFSPPYQPRFPIPSPIYVSSEPLRLVDPLRRRNIQLVQHVDHFRLA